MLCDFGEGVEAKVVFKTNITSSQPVNQSTCQPGNAEGNPKNVGNTSTGQGKIKAGKRSGLRRRAKNMQTMKAMAVSMKKTTKTMQAMKTARRANGYAEGVAKLSRTMMKAMKAMKTMKRVPARARRELDE